MPTLPLRRLRLQPLMAAQSGAPASTSFLVNAIEAWNLRQPSGGRSYAILRLATKEGLEGWGECRPLSRVEISSLRATVIGASATAYEALRGKLRSHPACAAVNCAALDIAAKAARAPLYQFLGGPTR